MKTDKNKRVLPTQKKLQETVQYYDGNLYWIERKNNRWSSGPLGRTDKHGYRVIAWINGLEYSAHRLIWVLFNGPIPKNREIDHIDRNRLNNKIENLRLVTHRENLLNSKRAKCNV